MSEDKCAPFIRNSVTCIALHLLIEMAKAYNEENPDNPIRLNEKYETIDRDRYQRYLVKEFTERLKDKCSTQRCWTEQSFIQRLKHSSRVELQKYTFRPNGPSGTFEWLNTNDINAVMEQYELDYPDFKYLGTYPVDFEELSYLKISRINFQDLIDSGKTKIGLIINLDMHNQPGSHWVALYADFGSGGIYFFDSVGVPPPTRISNFMKKIDRFNKGRGVKSIIKHNKVQHQRSDTECGVYSINFILRMLRGDTFDEISNNPVSDEKITKCRKVYFSSNK